MEHLEREGTEGDGVTKKKYQVSEVDINRGGSLLTSLGDLSLYFQRRFSIKEPKPA